jgi:hypothetical protein
MRDRYARLAFVLLILTFPRLIEAFADPTKSPTTPARTGASARASIGSGVSFRVEGIQAVLVIGLTLAGRERVRLTSRPSP